MRRFPQDALLDRMARRGALTPAAHDATRGRGVAAFHAQVARAGPGAAFGLAERTSSRRRCRTSSRFGALGPDAGDRAPTLARARAGPARARARCAPAFAARKRDGFVRECHGDLHLGNIALLDGRVTPFDCIEFNAGAALDRRDERGRVPGDGPPRPRPPRPRVALPQRLSGGDRRLRRPRGAALLPRLSRDGARQDRAACARTQPAPARRARRPHASSASTCAWPSAGRAARAAALVLMHGLSGSGKTTLRRTRERASARCACARTSSASACTASRPRRAAGRRRTRALYAPRRQRAHLRARWPNSPDAVLAAAIRRSSTRRSSSARSATASATLRAAPARPS